MGTPNDWLARHVRRDHDWLLERLRSLDNCLDNILYFGEVCSDLRGFAGLRLRCQELREILQHHIPEEEQLFAQLRAKSGESSGTRQLLDRLLEEHQALVATLEGCLRTLAAIESTQPLPEDLFTLQDRVRTLSTSLQRHIATENQLLLPLLDAA